MTYIQKIVSAVKKPIPNLASKSLQLLFDIISKGPEEAAILPSDKRWIRAIFSKPKVLKDVYLIHLTDVPELIVESGFRGVGLNRNMMRTRNSSAVKNGAFVFAFPDGYKPTSSDIETYGSGAVRFKAAEAIQVYHEDDSQIQVIADRKLISEITNVSKGNGERVLDRVDVFKEMRSGDYEAVYFAKQKAKEQKRTMYVVKHRAKGETNFMTCVFTITSDQKKLKTYTEQGFAVLKVDPSGETRIAVKEAKPKSTKK